MSSAGDGRSDGKATWHVAYSTKANMGWECPKCGSVYAPWVETCAYCPPRIVPEITTGAMNEIISGTCGNDMSERGRR